MVPGGSFLLFLFLPKTSGVENIFHIWNSFGGSRIKDVLQTISCIGENKNFLHKWKAASELPWLNASFIGIGNENIIHIKTVTGQNCVQIFVCKT